MALLEEKNLAGEAARRARFRVHHVGTKLNEAEVRELEALATKRSQTHAELIRGYGGGGGGGRGGGSNPGNPGKPFVFSVTAYLIWLQTFQLQLATLTSIPFQPDSSAGLGAAPSNVQQQTQQCIQQFYNSAVGKVVQFGSPLSLLPGWNSNWASNLGEWAVAIVGKGNLGTDRTYS